MTDTSSTYGIRHGVIYTACPSDLVSWGARVDGMNSYKQNYGQYVMVTVPDDDEGELAGQSWMIDTYHFGPCQSVPVSRSDDRENYHIEQAANRETMSSSSVLHYKWDCYYNACVPLTAGNAPLFKELVDLHGMCFVSEDEAADYETTDIVVGVHLFREHGYNSRLGGDIGITVRRKGAEKSPVRQALALASKASRERPSYVAGSYHVAARRLAEFAYGHRDDERVLRIYERHLPEIEFAERVCEEHRAMSVAYGFSRDRCDQMSLFDIDEDGNIEIRDEKDDE